MGRQKIKIEKLPINKINSTFTKRKEGLVNKAKELGILCDCDVALIVFHPKGGELIDVSYGGTIYDIYQKYINLKGCHPNTNQLICIQTDNSSAQQQHHVHSIHHQHQQAPINQLNNSMNFPTCSSMQQSDDVFVQGQANNSMFHNLVHTLNHMNTNQSELYQLQQVLQRMIMNMNMSQHMNQNHQQLKPQEQYQFCPI
ncbi:hypothetical protein KC19_4G202300, partial [Ceratodon purpureus]